MREMLHLGELAPAEDLSGPWCNSDAVTSSLMEAMSFVTPILERFCIRTVAEALTRREASELDQRCRTLIHEEANHSRAHSKFNETLLEYLGTAPPGLAIVQSLLNSAREHLPLSSKLLLAATLEHFSAVLSKGYLTWQKRWEFRSAFARELFARHAHEELSHRSVVFDLCISKGVTSRARRTLTLLGMMFGGLVYVSAAATWILYRKTGKKLTGTLSMLASFVMRERKNIRINSPLGELFCFAHGDYHPKSLIDEDVSDGIK